MKHAYMATSLGCVLLWSGLASAEEPEEFARKFVQAEEKAWQQGDVEDLERLEDPNVVYYTSGGAVLTAGFQAHKDFILSSRQSFAAIEQEWEYLAGDGNVFSMSYKSIAKSPTQRIETDAVRLSAREWKACRGMDPSDDDRARDRLASGMGTVAVFPPESTRRAGARPASGSNS